MTISLRPFALAASATLAALGLTACSGGGSGTTSPAASTSTQPSAQTAAPKPAVDPCAGIPDTATIAGIMQWPADAVSPPTALGDYSCKVERRDYPPGSMVIFSVYGLGKWDSLASAPDAPLLPGAKIDADLSTNVKTATQVRSVNVIGAPDSNNDKTAVDFFGVWK